MDDTSNATRRQFLATAGVAVASVTSLWAGTPASATPASLAAAIRDVTGGAAIRTGKVRLDVPPLVENGNTVPITISVASPMTEADHVKSIHVFNEKNPQPNVVNF